MDEAFIGSIVLFAGNYAPQNWAFCDGQLLSCSQNAALFSILGVTYGGDGKTTFALPDLRGRVPAGPRQGPGLQNINLGDKIGSNTNTLTINQMPAHSHPIHANAGTAGRNLAVLPTNNVPAQNQDASGNYAPSPDVVMSQQVIGISGGNQPFNNIQPTLGLNYIICLEGLYPVRE